ncbi:MAG TPA: hypothetical protein VIG69_13855, partial [Candidatus Methylomirabilis sp.]
MRRPLRDSLLACVCLLAFAPSPGQAQEPRKAGVVTALQGQATVARAALPQPAPLHFKDDVFFQDKVTTERDAVVKVLLEGKALVTIRELSDFTIVEGPNKSTVNLGLGRLALQVLKRLMRPGEEVEIRTPNAIAAVRGSFVVMDVQIVAGVPTTNIYALQITAPVTFTSIATGASVTLSTNTAVSLQGVGAAARMSPVVPIPPQQASDLAKTAATPRSATPSAPPANLTSNIATTQTEQAGMLVQAITGGTAGQGGDPALASASTPVTGQGGAPPPPPPPIPPPSTSSLGINATTTTQTVEEVALAPPPAPSCTSCGSLFLVQGSTVTVDPGTSLATFTPGPLQVPGFGAFVNQTGPVTNPFIQATGGAADTLAINTMSGGALVQLDHSSAAPTSPTAPPGPVVLISGTNISTNTVLALTSASSLTSTATPAAFQVINGSLTANSLVSADGTGNIFTHTGTLLAVDPATVTLGALVQSSGTDTIQVNRPTQPAISLGDGSTLTIPTGGFLQVPPGTPGTTLISFGTGSALVLQPGATFDIQTDEALAGPGGQIQNAGTLQKSGGMGTTAVTAALNNTGTVAVQSGLLSLQGGGSSTGSFTVAQGTTLDFNSSNYTLGGGSITGAGTAQLSGGTLTVAAPTTIATTFIDPTSTVDITGGTLHLTG